MFRIVTNWFSYAILIDLLDTQYPKAFFELQQLSYCVTLFVKFLLKLLLLFSFFNIFLCRYKQNHQD